MPVSTFRSAVVCLLSIAASVTCAAQTKLLRYPDIHGLPEDSMRQDLQRLHDAEKSVSRLSE